MNKNPLTLYQRLLQRTLMKVRPASLTDRLKRLLGVRRLPVETDQGRFLVDPVSLFGMELTGAGSFEPQMRATLEKFLGPGKTFVDLGANEGYFTVIGARCCAPGGRVVAVEPQTRLLPVIEENLRLNGSANVRLVNAAITDQRGTGRIHLTASTNSGGSSMHNACRYELPTQAVELLTLADLLDREGLDQVDMMKVDIEGHEYEAMLGSVEVFRTHRVRSMALEFHPEMMAARGKSCDDIQVMLADCGYEITKPFGHWVWTAPDA